MCETVDSVALTDEILLQKNATNPI